MTFDNKLRGRTAGIALVLSLFSSFPAAYAQEPAAAPTLTFQEALRRALEANPNTARARSDVSVAEAQLRQLRSAILPRVELNGSATRNSDEVTFDANGFEATILPENDWRYDVTLSQPIYAGGRELKALRQGRLNTSSAQQGVVQSEEQVLLGTATFYLAVVQGDELLAVERQNLELAERRRAQAQAFYEAGEVTRVDVLSADADTKAAQRAIASAEQVRGTAVSRLREALALDLAPGGSFQVQDPKLTFPRLPDAETLVREAQANRPEVRQAELTVEINRLEVAKQKAARLPTVRGELSFFNQASNFPAERYGAFTVNLTLPIWDSGEIASRVRTAEERRRQAEITLEENKRAVREDVLEALLDLQTAETSLALARDQLAAAEAEHQQTFELYRAQEATSLDLQAAESSLVAARRAVVTESLSRDLAELSVWSATGTLKNTILSEEVKP
ncbi:MAG TPA: TolC family protein [Thermoanaerobaculia bacterium]